MLRRKRNEPVIITRRDTEQAAQQNRRAIADRLRKSSDKDLATFIAANALAFGRAFFPEDPGAFASYISNFSASDLRRNVLPSLQKMEADDILALNTQNLGKIRNITTDAEVAAHNQEQHDRREAFRARGRKAFAGVGSDIKSGIVNLASVATGGASLRGAPFKLAAASMQLSILPASKIASGILAYGHVSRTKTYMSGAGTAAILGVMGSLPMVDSAPYATLLLPSDNSIVEACMVDGALASPANAAYATTESLFPTNGSGPMVREAMLGASAAHGVPAIALHYISYLETGRFRDVVANNSTARGLMHIVDATKFDYLQQYGQQTQIYLAARQNIDDGISSAQDRRLVEAIDHIVSSDLDSLKESLRLQTLTPLQDHARAIATSPDMQVELVALDMIRNSPEILRDNLNNEEILHITAAYYAKNHFLGAPTYNRLERMERDHPDLAIGRGFATIVAANPGLLSADMTAGEALTAIEDKFAVYVREPYQAFGQSYEIAQSVHVCLSEPARMELPDKISPFTVAMLESGYYRQLQETPIVTANLLDGIGNIAEPIAQFFQTDTPDLGSDFTTSVAIRQALQEAPTLAPDRSIRPVARPAHIFNTVQEGSAAEPEHEPANAGLHTSPRPRARPAALTPSES